MTLPIFSNTASAMGIATSKWIFGGNKGPLVEQSRSFFVVRFPNSHKPHFGPALNQ